MKPIVFEACGQLSVPLEEYLEGEVRRALSLPAARRKPQIARAWVISEEGKLHASLLQRYVLSSLTLDTKSINTLMRRLQSRGEETRGRPAKYSAKIRDLKYTRQLKVYLLNRLVAKGLGIDTSHWPPFQTPLAVRPSEPTQDRAEMLRHFEEWTGFVLPQEAWKIYAGAEREARRAA